MTDIYLYDDCPVLKNKLSIKDEKTLNLVEAEQSRANMALLYEQGFHEFPPAGLREIHLFLFSDVYEWAGKYRVINIEKRERLPAGRNVWYSNDDDISEDLDAVFKELHEKPRKTLSRTEIVRELARIFHKIWRAQPFREGNTRIVVMLLAFFKK